MQCGSSSLVVPSLVLVTENLGRDAQKGPEKLVREEVVFIFHDKAVARVDLTNAVIFVSSRETILQLEREQVLPIYCWILEMKMGITFYVYCIY